MSCRVRETNYFCLPTSVESENPDPHGSGYPCRKDWLHCILVPENTVAMSELLSFITHKI